MNAARRELGRRAMFRLLRGTTGGRLEIREGERTYGFGQLDSELQASVEIHDPRAYAWTLRGSTGLGEGYIEGLWSSADLVSLSRLCCRNLPALDRWRRAFHPVLGPLQRAWTLVPRNTRFGAAKNISAHYDLGNTLFESFLDETMMYSAAYFPVPDSTLEQAQFEKLERICDALRIGPADHVVEIGTGWGGLAVHAAATRGCRVTTTTISREQHAYAVERVRKEGLSDRIEVLLRDYRDLDGSYDKLVSIEMIEAVGWQYFPDFFAKCSQLTRPGGAMFLQAITIEDDAYEVEKASKSFANTHVFPGGCLPSLGLITELAARNGMPAFTVEDITGHYARTLEIWRRRYNDAAPSLAKLGYDERFRRLWNFYLAFSEGGFREQRIRDLQIVLAKPGWLAEESGWHSATPAKAQASLSS